MTISRDRHSAELNDLAPAVGAVLQRPREPEIRRAQSRSLAHPVRGSNDNALAETINGAHKTEFHPVR